MYIENKLSCSTSNKLSTKGINNPRLNISKIDASNNNVTKVKKENLSSFLVIE